MEKFIKYLISILIGIILYYILSIVVDKFNVGIPYGIIEITTDPGDGSTTQELVPSPDFGENLAEAVQYLEGDPDYDDDIDANITYAVAYYPNNNPDAEPTIVDVTGIKDISNTDVNANFKVVNADNFLKEVHKPVYTSSKEVTGNPREYTIPGGNTYRRVRFDRSMRLIQTGEDCSKYWYRLNTPDINHNGYTSDTREGEVFETFNRGDKVWIKIEDLQDMISSEELEQKRILSSDFRTFLLQWHIANQPPDRCVVTPGQDDRIGDFPECPDGVLRLPNIILQYDYTINRLVFTEDVDVQELLDGFQAYLIDNYNRGNRINPMDGFPLEAYVDYPIFYRDRQRQNAILDFRYLELTYKMSVSQMQCENVGIPLNNVMYLLGDRVMGMTESDFITDLFKGINPKFFHIGIFITIRTYIDVITDSEFAGRYTDLDPEGVILQFKELFENYGLISSDIYNKFYRVILRIQEELLRERSGLGSDLTAEIRFLSNYQNLLNLSININAYNIFIQCLQANNFRFVLLFRIFYWFDFDCEFAYEQIEGSDKDGQIYIGNYDWDFAPPMWAFALNGFTEDITENQLLNLNFTYMNRLLERLINNQAFNHDLATNELFRWISNYSCGNINYTDMFNRLNISLEDIMKLLCNIYQDYSKQIELGENVTMIQRLYRGLIYNGLFLLVYVQNRNLYRGLIYTFTIDPITHVLTITNQDGTEIDISTLVQLILGLEGLPKQFIYLIMVLFPNDYQGIFPADFQFPNGSEAEFIDPNCMVVANTIPELVEVTYQEEGEGIPPTAPGAGEGEGETGIPTLAEPATETLPEGVPTSTRCAAAAGRIG